MMRCLGLFLSLFLLVSAQALAQVSATQPSNPAPRPRAGTITGTVVNETGQPLQNALVYVRTFNSTRAVQSATSDNEGKFEINGLEPLTYQIFARHPVYTLLPRDASTPNNYHIGEVVRLVMVKGGVITGTVTTQTGEPVIGVKVRITNVSNSETIQERSTDDRGIYRVYGLPSGKYVVWAGGGGQFQSMDPYDTDVPTYSPASTRDTAAEINVRAGEETTNVDIRYRGEPGRAVSGTVINPTAGPSGVMVSMTSATEGGYQTNTGFSPGDNDKPGFVFYGVDDGDYTLSARTVLQSGEWSISSPKRISVRGADVTGVELSLKPLGSVSGQVVLEELKTKECGAREAPLLTETLVSAWHKQDEAARAQPGFVWGLGGPVNADAQGNLTMRNLASGDYYFVTRFVGKSWYLQSISVSSAAKKTVDATHVWTAVKNGDRISGLKITLAEGAASLSGQVVLGGGEAMPEKTFIYVVPAEKEKADEILRFYATPVDADGKITLNNLAPGRYWLLARPELEGGLTKLRLPDESDSRAKLRREAEAGKTEIELKPCQNLVDYRLKLQ